MYAHIHIKVSTHHRVRTDELRMFKWMVPHFEVGPVPGGWDVVLLTGGPVSEGWEVFLVDSPVPQGWEVDLLDGLYKEVGRMS